MTVRLFFLALLLAACAHAELTDEQRRVPLEADSPDPKLAKVVMLAGSVSNKPGQHEYFAGCALMMEWLKQNGGVWPVLAANGWPQDERIFDGAKTVLVYADGGAKLPFLEPARLARMRKLMAAGTGFVMLHQSVDVPESQEPELQAWLGAAWTKDIGCRGHWDMAFGDFLNHPVMRGVQPFSAPLDGWLYNLHFAEHGVTTLLAGAVPDKSRTTQDAQAHMGRAEIIGWAYERPDGGRSFGFTGCDLHRNWQVESQRRLVTNAIFWTAKIEVPDAGARVDFNPAELARNLDSKPVPPTGEAAPKKPVPPPQ